MHVDCLEYSKWLIINQFRLGIGYGKIVSKWIQEKTECTLVRQRSPLERKVYITESRCTHIQESNIKHLVNGRRVIIFLNKKQSNFIPRMTPLYCAT